VKIGALFADYDGTIAPSSVTREDSRVPPEVADKLKVLSSLIPIAIITSKDYAFIHPRTEFASAWACCSGLEITLANGNIHTMKPLLPLTTLNRIYFTCENTIFLNNRTRRHARSMCSEGSLERLRTAIIAFLQRIRFSQIKHSSGISSNLLLLPEWSSLQEGSLALGDKG
jgi:hydroxymethylpyrimidine pyrophosphatase-like HAD family hydrolase